MEFKVKEVETIESKSIQEIEQELLNKHEAQMNQQENEAVEQQAEAPVSEMAELKEEDVLSFIGNRYGRQVKSLDDLIQVKEESSELPEDIAAYLKYKKETGRGIKDFVKLNESSDDISPDELLASYYAATESDLDEEDIQFLLNEKFHYDEDLDDESDVKRKKLAKKKELAKARQHFEEQREKYRAPLESSMETTSGVNQEELQAYREYLSSAQSAEDENRKRYEWFQQKTSEVFGDEFKGFEFNVNDKTFSFSPAETAELKNVQSDIMNFFKKFTNEDGLIDNAKGYHRALAVAMNPERFAKFFYEQGMSDAVDDLSRKSKNINMDIRQSPQAVSKGGFKVASLSQDSGRGLKIKNNNK